ncbi:MAG: 4-alpha-glucanotransferase [bacterium]
MRKSGILLHITSLPSREGIGTLGEGANKFIEFLNLAEIKLWQVLPLGHIGYGNSPYQTYSAFAGNPYLINLDTFAIIDFEESGKFLNRRLFDYRVDYDDIVPYKIDKLKYYLTKMPLTLPDYYEFCYANRWWLDDYALFMVLKDNFKGLPWYEWPEEYKSRHSDKIDEFRKQNEHTLELYRMMQHLFFQDWSYLKQDAHHRGIEIIGDMPIYVSLDSVDVWCHPELFQLDDKLNPISVAGVPPDYFSETGQLWGNPLYNWEEHKKTNFDWWMRRFEQSFELFDYVRFDHFRGLESYWAVPNGEESAVNGVWIKAPGEELLQLVIEKFGGGKLIAEDLGIITDEVRQLRDKFDLPGMKILQFAFSANEESSYLPHNHIKNCVVYTGTHDNDTIKGWFEGETLSEEDKQYALNYLHTDESHIVDAMIRAAYASVADTAIIPMQDWLKLGSYDRMNTPGEECDNWECRINRNAANQELAERIRKMVRTYRR